MSNNSGGGGSPSGPGSNPGGGTINGVNPNNAPPGWTPPGSGPGKDGFNAYKSYTAAPGPVTYNLSPQLRPAPAIGKGISPKGPNTSYASGWKSTANFDFGMDHGRQAAEYFVHGDIAMCVYHEAIGTMEASLNTCTVVAGALAIGELVAAGITVYEVQMCVGLVDAKMRQCGGYARAAMVMESKIGHFAEGAAGGYFSWSPPSVMSRSGWGFAGSWAGFFAGELTHD